MSISIRIIMYPFLLIKTRLQVTDHYKSTYHAFKTIINTEGSKALYKGFSANLINALNAPIYIGALEYSKMFVI